MQENLSSLPLVKLREMAKARGVKNLSSIRKSELVEILDKLMEQENTEESSVSDNKSEENSSSQGNPKSQEQDAEDGDISGESTQNRRTQNRTRRNDNGRTGTSRNETSRNENNRNENNRNETSRNETSRNENNRNENNRNENSRIGNNRNDSGRTGNNWSENSRSGSSRTENSRTEYGRNENNRTENSRTGNNRNENSRTGNNRNENSWKYNGRGNAEGDGAQRSGRTYHINRNHMNEDGQNHAANPSGSQSGVSQSGRSFYSNYSNGTQSSADASAGSAARSEELESLDSGQTANGILEIISEGYGFIRSDNYLSGDRDVYVSPSQIRRFNLKTGDMIEGAIRISQYNEKYPALLFINQINGEKPDNAVKRPAFESLVPIFPDTRLSLETPGCKNAMRIMNLFSPIGKGQRGMIVSPPKAGKTTLLKQVANAVKQNHPEVHIIILLIDERPEEVTDIKEYIEGSNVEVIYSTFDELPEHHKRVSEMVLERAKRLVEHGNDVMILLDSITRLTRAYNLTVTASGRTLSGGLDPAALHFPKKFFGAARNMRNGGSLTILATALVDTGSRMDDVVFEEFKGTGNMEIVLDRKLSERRVFPAIDLMKSGTRRDDLLLSPEEQEAMHIIRRTMNSMKQEEVTERVTTLMQRTRSNKETVDFICKYKSLPNLAGSGQ